MLHSWKIRTSPCLSLSWLLRYDGGSIPVRLNGFVTASRLAASVRNSCHDLPLGALEESQVSHGQQLARETTTCRGRVPGERRDEVYLLSLCSCRSATGDLDGVQRLQTRQRAIAQMFQRVVLRDCTAQQRKFDLRQHRSAERAGGAEPDVAHRAVLAARWARRAVAAAVR